MARYTFTNLARHDGRKIFLLIHQHQVLQRAGLEKECVALLQGHGGGKLWFLIVISQMGNLIQIAKKQSRYNVHPAKALCETMCSTGHAHRQYYQ